MKGQNGLAFRDFFAFTQLKRDTRSTTRNSLLLDVPRKGLNARAHSFAERTVRYWNCLTDEQVLAPSTNAFRSRLGHIDLGCLCLVHDF